MDPREHAQPVEGASRPSEAPHLWRRITSPDVDPPCSGGKPRPLRADPRRDARDHFVTHRPRLFGIARRMLGSQADAEDLLQDVYLRWHQSAKRDIQSPLAFLITVTTRLCLDRLRSLKQQGSQYRDPPLTEPLAEDHTSSPETQLEFREKVSTGFITVLECLGPEERAAFLLHDVFDYDYHEVAGVLARTEPCCRQMIHRARARLREPRARFPATPESRERLLERFFAAITSGDRRDVMALLAEQVDNVADVGSNAIAAIGTLRVQNRLGWLGPCIAGRAAEPTYRTT